VGVEINQYDVWLVNLDPTIGYEIKKKRPCLIISPDEMNRNIKTVIIAPMTTKSRNYPTRVNVIFENKNGWIVLDQLRTIDKIRLIKRLEIINFDIVNTVKMTLKEMLVD
jgi:mRNA interferase MazF